MNTINVNEIQEFKEKKLFQCFIGDDGSKESCSVFYADLVLAENKDEAIEVFMEKNGYSNKNYLSAIEIGVIYTK